ncbi:MAG: riboflavin synthase, partial [Pseudomonadota bacterium]
ARVASLTPVQGDVRLKVDASGWEPPTPVALGDSISISGACLTVVQMHGLELAFDVSRETLDKTTLGDLAPGALVNLEPSLRAGDVLGGHLVTGHVDALGEVLAIRPEARSHRLEISLPSSLQPLVASKGSVCMDGVSLTVNEVLADRFGVNIIPHTWEVTSFAEYTVGRRVNLEADVLARYVARQLAVAEAPITGSAGISQ